MSVQEIMKLTGVSRASIYRIGREKMKKFEKKKKDRKLSRGGKKLTIRDQRALLRQLHQLRRNGGQFSSKRLAEVTGLSRNVSDRTVRRWLNQNGYFYLQSRKKGLMSDKDKNGRVDFAKSTLKKYEDDLWTSKIEFYLDGVGIYYKRNPADQARSAQGRIWRLKSEGLKQGCTTKGSKEGSGGKVLKLMVAISYGKGVVHCYPYTSLNGDEFHHYAQEHFDEILKKTGKGTRLFLQDNDPSQNCKQVKALLKRNKIKQLTIPPRSPDLNPIENVFHLLKMKLRKDAIARNIVRETFEQFKDRVMNTLYDLPVEVIDKTIASMNKRVQGIIKCKGERLKY